MQFEYKARSSVAGNPYCHRLFLNQWEDTGCPAHPFPNTDTWTKVERLGSMSKYIDASRYALGAHLRSTKNPPHSTC